MTSGVDASFYCFFFFFFQAEDGIRDLTVTGVQTCALPISSLLTNYELDVVVESETLTDALADQFERDLAAGREIALMARRRGRLPARLMGTPATAGDALTTTGEHKRSGYELGAVAVVALRRVPGGLRRAIARAAPLAR